MIAFDASRTAQEVGFRLASTCGFHVAVLAVVVRHGALQAFGQPVAAASPFSEASDHAGLPAYDQAATCRSDRKVGSEGELELAGGQRISPLLVAGEDLIGRLGPGRGLVDGVREQVGGRSPAN